MNTPGACPMCDRGSLEPLFEYDAPPPGETPHPVPPGETYNREVHRCDVCGHFVRVGGIEVTYGGEYVDATYGDRMKRAYERVMTLPEEKSDNSGRVARVLSHLAPRVPPEGRTLLDVGSGLAVFPVRMREAGWRTVALDPDPRAAAHARDTVGVEAVCADFMDAEGIGTFSLVTLNKVVEHVADPRGMLARARSFLVEGGHVYVEVPDGTSAAREGPDRQEFFVDHLHCFSVASLSLLVERSGFDLARLDRIRDPSGKLTLAAFITCN